MFVNMLAEKLPQNAQVAVFPCASIQVVAEESLGQRPHPTKPSQDLSSQILEGLL